MDLEEVLNRVERQLVPEHKIGDLVYLAKNTRGGAHVVLGLMFIPDSTGGRYSYTVMKANQAAVRFWSLNGYVDLRQSVAYGNRWQSVEAKDLLTPAEVKARNEEKAARKRQQLEERKRKLEEEIQALEQPSNHLLRGQGRRRGAERPLPQRIIRIQEE